MDNELITKTKLFGEFQDSVVGVVDDEVLQKFEELCASYLVEPSHIVNEWVAFASKRFSNVEPILENVCQFERDCLSKRLTKTPVRKLKSFTTPTSQNRLQKSEFSGSVGLGNYSGNSPDQYYGKTKQFTSETPPSAFSPSTPGSNKYNSRSSKGDVICTWGETSNCSWTSSDSQLVAVRPYDSEQSLTDRYQFMYEKLKDRAYVLSDIIEDMASLFKKEHDIEEWNDFCLPSPNEMTVVGRICSDSSGKINTASILLEGSIDTCSGKTVHLDVSKLSNCSFFPGQIIAGTGINVLGKALLMSSLYQPVSLPFPQQIPVSKTKNLQLVIGTGPFTTVDNLDFEPLKDLLKYLIENKPHVCILIGPFVDSKNDIEKNILGEDLASIYDKLFKLIEAARKECGTNIVIVSSANDIMQDYIYPTPPYTHRGSHKLQFFADPSVLRVDGVVIGVTATDVLFHLSKEEIALPGATDRLGRLAQHILTQRSFYPLYPPNEVTNIDYGHFETYAKLPVMPHILILPSDLRCFIKNIDGCVCINTERLIKGAGGGNFARIQIDIDSSTFTDSIADHVKGEIVKI